MGELIRQRSMLVILVAACKTALTAFEAGDKTLDAELRADISKLIERSESELAKLSQRIDESS
jgi:hypothetical protein